MSEQTIYVWRRKFGELDPADMKRLRQLEQENSRLNAERKTPIASAVQEFDRIRAISATRDEN